MATYLPIFFPEGWPTGPWGVNSNRNAWYVCHTPSGRAKRIGRVGARGPINYFDRAMEEAARRNEKETTR